MGLKNPFRRSSARHDDGNAVHDAMRPWWAWGPLGFIWFSGHHDSGNTNIDSGMMHHPGDAGHYNHNIDPGGGFGGFDGGAGGGV